MHDAICKIQWSGSIHLGLFKLLHHIKLRLDVLGGAHLRALNLDIGLRMKVRFLDTSSAVIDYGRNSSDTVSRWSKTIYNIHQFTPMIT